MSLANLQGKLSIQASGKNRKPPLRDMTNAIIKLDKEKTSVTKETQNNNNQKRLQPVLLHSDEDAYLEFEKALQEEQNNHRDVAEDPEMDDMLYSFDQMLNENENEHKEVYIPEEMLDPYDDEHLNDEEGYDYTIKRVKRSDDVKS